MRAQITMFIIIGIMIVVAFAIALYAGSRLGIAGKSQQVEAQLGIQEIEGAVQTCLGLALGEGLKLMGSQGGYIFTDQGGVQVRGETLRVPSAQGVEDVPLVIAPPKGDVGNLFFADVPRYPFDGFPYPPGKSTPFFTGYYGISGLPPLYKLSDRQEHINGSIQETLESFVAKKTVECMDWESFKGKGFEATVGEAQVSLLFANRQDQFVGEQFVTASLFWPLEITAPDKSKVVFKESSERVPVRLASIYYVVKSIVDGDVTDVSYVPSGSGGMDVSLSRTADGSVIRVRDNQSQVQNAPFEFLVARKNRLPGLWEIDTAALDKVVFHVTPEHHGTRVGVEGSYLKFQDPCPDEGVQSPFVIQLNASDPDEDVPSFEVQVQGSSEPELKEIGDGTVRVYAKDDSAGSLGEFDRQDLKVKVALCPVR